MMIRTAAGPRWLDGSNGHVLAHEHLLMDNRVWWEGEGPPDVLDAGGPLDFSTALPEIRRLPDGIRRENLVLADWYLAALELREAVRAGCGLVVELTSDGLDPQPVMAARAAQLAGIDLVLGIGRYVDAALSPQQREMDVATLTELWGRRIQAGLDGDGPLYGVLGELGLSPVPTAVELTTVEAAAALSDRFDLPIAVHGALGPWDHLAVADVLKIRGLRPERTVIAHRDAMLDLDELRDWTSLGFLVGFDLFATGPHRRLEGRPFPSDENRIAAIETMASWELHDHIVVSHDLCTRDQLQRFGGPGYGHLGRQVLPSISARTSAAIADAVGTTNALRWLSTTRPLPAAAPT